MAGTQIVEMRHPDVTSNGQTTLEAYNAVWRHKGWVLVTAAAAAASQVLGRAIEKVEELNKDELRTVLDVRGVSTTGTKTELLAALEVNTGGNSPAVVGVVDDDGDEEQGSERFDPSAHTVTEVNEYLALADATERQRVLDLESTGSNLKGFTERGN